MELNPINQVNPLVIGATVGTFTLTYLVMRKVFFIPVVDVMEKRRERVEAAEEKYAEADDILTRAETECTEIRQSANEEADALLAKSRAKTEELRENRLADARADAERVLEHGRMNIRDEAEAERARLRAEAVACVSMSCEKLFGKADPSVVESSVDRVIAKTLH